MRVERDRDQFDVCDQVPERDLDQHRALRASTAAAELTYAERIRCHRGSPWLRAAVLSLDVALVRVLDGRSSAGTIAAGARPRRAEVALDLKLGRQLCVSCARSRQRQDTAGPVLVEVSSTWADARLGGGSSAAAIAVLPPPPA